MKLPKGWKTGKVGCLFDVQLGKMLNEDARTKGEQQPYLTNYNVQWGRFDLSKLNEMHFSERDKSKFALKKGDLVVCEGGEVGRCAIWREEVTPCFFQKTLHRLRPIDGEVVPEFMFAYMRFISGSKRVSDLTTRSSIAHLTREQFCKLDVMLPPLSEQRKIADILSTWDDALEKLDALIAAKERRKKGLMQHLLTGKRRMKGFDKSAGRTSRDRFGIYPADWKRVSLGEISVKVVTRNVDGAALPVLSCTKHQGLVLSEEYFGRRVYSDDTSDYRVVKRGEYAYATNHIEEGSIGYQNVCDAGLVSPIYTVFKSTDEVEDRYLYRVLKSVLLVHLYRANTSSSVDRRGGLRYDEFAKIHVWLPGKKEQRAIADILDACDDELRLLRDRRAAIERQKRGLMQKLLAGKVRVNV